MKASANRKYDFDKPALDVHKGSAIQIRHIICILIYCNFPAIKDSFCDTFQLQPMDKFEQWKDVRSNHSEFAHFGRILNETIQCFGSAFSTTRYDGDSVFYRGLFGSFALHSMEARFFVPTSMTSELSVISYYCYNAIKSKAKDYDNGLIVGWTATQAHSDTKHFDCSFLSDFSIEAESIFLSARHTMRIDAIYNVKEMQNYQHYLYALNMLKAAFVQSAAPSAAAAGGGGGGGDECEWVAVDHRLRPFRRFVSHHRRPSPKCRAYP
eukprot:CAMPEP_0202696072 /NCGR_PEP_ID=MMETSP1385-20130828/9441_1 /ASSEMBLY_ACC=CAM_ASM_000861 /TAXON_ID=933848 /ORGANISM="Elphidium margaritaceum" /LENGTH=266 /DNA_ID=CAMNT_0049352175 /DNA_START=16 /DNA_END=816 /DNA_ORIENTATION=-